MKNTLKALLTAVSTIFSESDELTKQISIAGIPMYWIDQDGAERPEVDKNSIDYEYSYMKVEDVLTVLTAQQIAGIKQYTFNEDGDEREVEDDSDTYVWLKVKDVLPLLKKWTND